MSVEVISRLALEYFERLNSPFALSQAVKLREGDWLGVLSAKLDPRLYESAEAYARDNAAACFLKKNPFVPGSDDASRRQKARDNWELGEAQCYRSNQRLARYLPGLGIPADGQVQYEFLELVRDIVVEFVGASPPSDSRLQEASRHGPGTTFQSLVRDPTAADKFSEKATLTRNAIWHLADLVGTRWGASLAQRYITGYDDCVEVVRGDRFSTAPKDALKDRSIVIGPSINTYCQLGVGSALRSELKRRTGWDLSTCAEVHRRVAQQASIDGKFSTIDLSNASDSLCKNLVRILFSRPHSRNWLSLMDDLRTTHTRLPDGSWRYLEKFSGMGNGYTFELETVTFAAICAAVLRLKGHAGLLGYDLFVFGDDIIVPTDTAGLVIATLAFCGFEVNRDKTFVDGSFRESCGGDYLMGVPVRGFYFKREGTSDADLFHLHNGVKRLLADVPVIRDRDLSWVTRRIHPAYARCGGPERLGDSVLHGVRPHGKWEHGIYKIRTVVWEAPLLLAWKPYFDDDVILTCLVRGYGDSFGISTRGKVYRPRLAWASGS